MTRNRPTTAPARREARKCLPPHWQRTKHPRCDRIRTQFFGQLTIWPPNRFRR